MRKSRRGGGAGGVSLDPAVGSARPGVFSAVRAGERDARYIPSFVTPGENDSNCSQPPRARQEPESKSPANVLSSLPRLQGQFGPCRAPSTSPCASAHSEPITSALADSWASL